jgi:hypothetical protein
LRDAAEDPVDDEAPDPCEGDEATSVVFGYAIPASTHRDAARPMPNLMWSWVR